MGTAYPITTVQQTGADDNRADMVFLGDGCTAGQLSTHAANVAGLLDYLFTDGAGDVLSAGTLSADRFLV